MLLIDFHVLPAEAHAADWVQSGVRRRDVLERPFFIANPRAPLRARQAPPGERQDEARCGWQLAVLHTCARGGAQETGEVKEARAGGAADEGLTGLGLLDSGVFASHDRARRTGGPKSEESSVPLRALLPRCSRHFMMASRDPPAGGSLDGSCSRWPEATV